MEKLKVGAKFDDVAREFSEDKARQGTFLKLSVCNVIILKLFETGGALGWKTRGSLDPAFEAVAFELEASTTSNPKYAEAKSGFGYHIIMVEGRK